MSENWNTRFEVVGDLYYSRHRRLRPGKSEPMETGRDANSEENRELFDQWFATKAFTDAIDHIAELQRELDAWKDSTREA